MDGQAVLPGWVRATPFEVRDLWCLSMRLVVERQSRDAAGMVAALGWLQGLIRGPATARPESAVSRDVALCELCAAESLLGDGAPPPPLGEVCRMLGVVFVAPLDMDAGYARGVWRTLLWVLGSASRPPLELPIRRLDGSLMNEVEMFSELIEGAGVDARDRACTDAAVLVADSRRLAALVEDTAARVHA
jgi:hypothetical protein